MKFNYKIVTMNKSIKIIKPSLTTHTKLIGNLCYILIEQIFNDIMNDLNLPDKEKELIKHKMISTIQIEYKILNKHRNILK